MGGFNSKKKQEPPVANSASTCGNGANGAGTALPTSRYGPNAPAVPTSRYGPNVPAVHTSRYGPSAPAVPASRHGPSAPAVPTSRYGPSAPAVPTSRYGLNAPAVPTSRYGPSAPDVNNWSDPMTRPAASNASGAQVLKATTATLTTQNGTHAAPVTRDGVVATTRRAWPCGLAEDVFMESNVSVPPCQARGVSDPNDRLGSGGDHRTTTTTTTSPTTYSQLSDMVGKDVLQVIDNLRSPTFGFAELLKQQGPMRGDQMSLVVHHLASVCSCKNIPQQKASLLDDVVRSPFFTCVLPQFLMSYCLNSDSNNKASCIVKEAVEDVAKVLSEVLQTMPVTTLDNCAILLVTFKETVRKLTDRGVLSALLLDRLLMEEADAEAVVSSRRAGSSKEPVVLDDTPEDFRTLLVIPTKMDVHTDKLSFVRPNLVGGQYKSVDHYLDVQFRLMREDFIAPLREVVLGFLKHNNKKNKKKKKGSNTMISHQTYHDVRILSAGCDQSIGVTFTLAFDAERLRDVNWEGSKRLMEGSLVCLSCNDFETFALATIINRNEDRLAEGCVTVKFLAGGRDSCHSAVEFDKVYVMIESPAYFEAYGPVMRGLQSFDGSSLPFAEYLVRAKADVGTPRYLTKETLYNLKFLQEANNTNSGSKNEIKMFKPLSEGQWPGSKELGMDRVQYKAFRHALTNELALIQGPPGTGKTFLGLRIVEALLANNRAWSDKQNPIVVICYTNHALDQFLEGIHRFVKDGIVRVGSKSQSKVLKKFFLSKLRHGVISKGKVPCKVHKQRQLLMQQMNTVRRDISAEMRVVRDTETAVVYACAFSEFMVERHAKQLEQNASRTEGEPTMVQWLGLSCPPCAFNPAGRAQALSEEDEARMEDWQKSMKAAIRRELKDAMAMSREQAERIEDVWTLSGQNRWRLYRYWVLRLKEVQMAKIKASCEEYDGLYQRLKEARSEIDVRVLREAHVIGMTTSGAAKNRDLLKAIAPKIVVVEEAAEVLEAHIVTALTEHCQHLIMIGDQQQLRPSPTMHELARDYHMDVSLFERLIKNGVRHVRLEQQHRMRPSICSLLVPHIYERLTNHASVLAYDDIRGVSSSVYFITHKFEESSIVDSTSRANRHEAAYLAGLCRYLLAQAYEPSQITVLTTYQGQVALLQEAMADVMEAGVQCTTVDNYQGEENDIVLLSLVRSNQHESVGFLKVENRVCVALSRARKGFFCIGNFELLLKNCKLWQSIVAQLVSKRMIGDSLQLACPRHPDRVRQAGLPEHFSFVSADICCLELVNGMDGDEQCLDGPDQFQLPLEFVASK